jgi:hypothetical protein
LPIMVVSCPMRGISASYGSGESSCGLSQVTIVRDQMPDRQLDLFEGSGARSWRARTDLRPAPRTAPADLDDTALIAALPWAGLIEAQDLAAEAARRRLTAAIPALEQLCRRFARFGLERPVPEQVAALRALGQIGGAEAAHAVARLIVTDAVQYPGRKLALAAR